MEEVVGSIPAAPLGYSYDQFTSPSASMLARLPAKQAYRLGAGGVGKRSSARWKAGSCQSGRRPTPARCQANLASPLQVLRLALSHSLDASCLGDSLRKHGDKESYAA